MIKKVAQAILDAGEGCQSGLVYVNPHQAAIAAIEAMRDPTDEMAQEIQFATNWPELPYDIDAAKVALSNALAMALKEVKCL